MKSEKHQAQYQVERECLQAVYAYEAAQSNLEGRKFRANRTWQMINRHGIIAAVERAVNRSNETMGYQTLVEMGMGEFAFERVILRHPTSFSEEVVSRSRERVGEHANDAWQCASARRRFRWAVPARLSATVTELVMSDHPSEESDAIFRKIAQAYGDEAISEPNAIEGLLFRPSNNRGANRE